MIPQAAARAGRQALSLVMVALAAMTVLFFLLRLTGDPAVALAGENASPDQIAAIRAAYGFDRSLVEQYLIYMGKLIRLDFGLSLADGSPALEKALISLPATLFLAAMALTANLVLSIPFGAWLGQSRMGAARRIARNALSVLQGFPGFVTALLVVQVFAVGLEWLPAVGYAGPATWILPVAAIVSFLAPKLIRVIDANVDAAFQAPYVRTARAMGAPESVVLWRHVMPNALQGAVALIGAEFAFMVTGLVIIETIFAWPGVGWLLVQSTLALDFPVVQALTFVIVILVFVVNLGTDMVQAWLNPVSRSARA